MGDDVTLAWYLVRARRPPQELRASRHVSRARAPHGLSVTARAANSPRRHRALSPAKPRPGSVLAQSKTVTQSDTAVNATAAGSTGALSASGSDGPLAVARPSPSPIGRRLRGTKDVVVRRGGQPLGGGRVVARSGRGAHPGATQPPRDPAHHATLGSSSAGAGPVVVHAGRRFGSSPAAKPTHLGGVAGWGSSAPEGELDGRRQAVTAGTRRRRTARWDRRRSPRSELLRTPLSGSVLPRMKDHRICHPSPSRPGT